MQHKKTALRALVVAVAGATTASLSAIPTATAATDGTNVVINEVYGGGGNSGATHLNDFVELYNPTDEDIDVTGWVIDQQSAKGNSGGSLTLSGVVPAGGYFLIQGSAGNGNGAALPSPDNDGGFNFSGSGAIAELTDASGAIVDLVGWGGATGSEGSPAPGTSNAVSVQRAPDGVDTDDNAADFVTATPNPINSGNESGGTDDSDTGGAVPGEHGEITPIAEIQGTGATTPLDGQTVTTNGVVTAVYAEGGKNGFYLQTAGTGEEPKSAGDASDGIFVYLGQNPTVYPEAGQSLVVTGEADEYYGATQLSAGFFSEAEEDLGGVAALEIETLPADDAVREAHEGMLLQPTGGHTVTDNYELNTFGTVELAPGTQAFRQATDAHVPDTDPESPAQQLMAEQAAQSITLDDGRTRNYLQTDTRTPLPWIAQDGGQTIKSLRTDDVVDFQNPVVLDYSFDAWTFQPTAPVTGDTAGADLPINWEDSRAAERGAMAAVEGEHSVATFNVLNYFTTLGHTESGCGYYEDIYGAPVATNWCDVRGAYSESAFDDQQTKIVKAINELDASVVSLEEIENTAALTGDVSRRDEALALLVDALNAAAGADKWNFVPSPDQIGTDEDVIRNAFIYQPAEVQAVGESRIFDDQAFTGVARQPLAQEFAPSGADPSAEGTDTFVAVTNHFKSKGSVVQGDAATGDGQGNNPNVRNAQSQALLQHLNDQTDWADTPVFILGDLNSYSRETAVATLLTGGFTNINESHAGGQATYQFDGRLGSLDHALGNDAAMELVADAEVWDINADEPIAFEYSRRNYNIVDFHDDSPFRSSDHDPVKVGLNLAAAGEAGVPGEPTPASGVVSVTVDDAGHLLVEYADGTVMDLGPMQDTDDTDGRGIQSIELVDGALVATMTDGSVVNLGPVRGADGTDGAEGRGVESLVVNDEGHLIITYTDGETADLGRVTGEAGADGAPGDAGQDGRDGEDAAGSSLGGVLSALLGVAAGALGMVGIVGVLGDFFPQVRQQIENLVNNFR